MLLSDSQIPIIVIHAWAYMLGEKHALASRLRTREGQDVQDVQDVGYARCDSNRFT